MSKPRKFQASLQPDGALELLIYGDIGEDFWSYSGGITASTVRAQIDAAPNATKIVVRIDSDGGDAFDGIAIYNVLRLQKEKGKAVEGYVDGLAASAASIIAMACSTLTMGVNTCMMIHNASAGWYGTAADFRKIADSLDVVSEAIAQSYITRTGKSLDEIKALLDAETWMTAQECLDQKFCTALAEDPISEVQDMAVRRKSIEARLRRRNELAKPSVRNEANTKTVDGEALTWSDFIIALDHEDPDTWHLPYKFSTLEKTKAHLRDALSRFDQVEGLSKEQKHAAYAKLVRLCKQYGIEVSPEDRAKLKARAAADGMCACDCDNCMDGECSACSNEKCDDPNCEDCPMQQDADAAAERDRLQAEIQLRKMKFRSSAA